MSNRRSVGLLAVILGAASATVVEGQCEVSKFTAPSAPSGAELGYSFSVSGERMSVGTSTGQDAVYVFLRTGLGFVQEARIQPNDHTPDKFFGPFQSLSGDRLLVGAMGDDHAGPWSGAAYIFLREGNTWSQEAKLTASDAATNAFFGRSVMLAGDTAFISADRQIYSFRRVGGTWVEEDPYPESWGTATDGQTLVMNGTSLIFYHWTGSEWVAESTLPPAAGDQLSISGNFAAVGAPQYFNYGGKVDVYFRNNGVWGFHSTLQPSDTSPEMAFGESTSLVGDRLLVGARKTHAFDNDYCKRWAGSAYLFRFNGSQWVEESKFIPSDPAYEDIFGTGVAIGSDFYAIGAPGDDNSGSQRGAVYLYSTSASQDCNANKVMDSCELFYATSADCNGNSRPDECDIADGISEDCTGDGRPDECDPDCNNNGSADSCDIASLTSTDCNKNKIPDECDLPFECIEIDDCLVYTATATAPPYLGSDVAIDGNWAVITSPREYDDNRDGIALIYTRSGTSWVLQANLGLAGADRAAISGDTAVVVFGAAFVFRRNGSTWALETTLPGDPVAIDGDTLILRDRVYRRSGTTWSLEATLTPEPNVSQQFGWDVDIDGDLAIVGATGYPNYPNGDFSGAAYIFRREGVNWVQEAQLLPLVPEELGKFGTSVAISGDYAIVGEPGYDCPERPGRAAVFRRNGQSWSQVATLMAIPPLPGDYFGYSVSIDGDRIVVGSSRFGGGTSASGTWVFALEAGGHYWIPQEKIFPINGFSTAISGPWAVVGDPYGFDAEAHFFAVGEDCNANGKADICDIRAGVSQDADGDNRPDECPQCGGYERPAFSVGPTPEPFPACSSGPYVSKNRYLTFIPPKTPFGAASVALRVTMGPMPGANDCPGIADFSAFDGTQMWVGPEFLAGAMPTGIHRLQSIPYFYNWSLLPGGVVNLSDCNIVPCASYKIEAISNVDYPNESYSPALVLSTSLVWGDVVDTGSGTPPNGIVDFFDISVLVDRFKALPTAPPGTWCDLASSSPTQGVVFGIDFSDISVVVDAFRGRPYPFAGPTAPDSCP